MSNQFDNLFTQQTLGVTSVVVYTMPTAPSGTKVFLRNGRVLLVNTAPATRYVTLYADVAATASSDANSFGKNIAIPSGGSMQIDVPEIPGGYTIRGLADVAGVVNIWPMDGLLVSP